MADEQKKGAPKPPSDDTDTSRRRGEDDARTVSRLEAANRELDAFARAVSLELQEPMRSLLRARDALLADYTEALDDRGRQELDRMSASVSRMEQLVDGLVTLASVSVNELHDREVDLSVLAREVAAQLAARAIGRPVELVVRDGLIVRGDPYWLRALLTHLLDNAWKAVSSHSHPRVELGKSPAGQPAVYFIRDNGIGFDMGYADRLFRPFQSLGPGSATSGGGIGLLLAKRIVRRHGGFIWAEGAVGTGATFYFTLQ